MKKNNYEIERKFIIEYPDIIMISKLPGVQAIDIVQTYLLPTKPREVLRVRKCSINGKISFIKTSKFDVSPIRRIEVEDIITEKEYLLELKNRDTKLNQIIKTRYKIENQGKVFEIDVYPFWKEKAIMEVELSHEDEKYTPPEFINIIKEVTGDKKYTNYGLAINTNI